MQKITLIVDATAELNCRTHGRDARLRRLAAGGAPLDRAALRVWLDAALDAELEAAGGLYDERRILDERRTRSSGESAPSTALLSTSTPAAPTEFTDEQKAIAHQALSSRDALVRASARIIEGQHDQARQEAAKAEPGVKAGLEQAARYFRVMGDSYYFQRQFDEAIPHYQRVLDTLGSMAAPNDLINLANALAQARRGDGGAQAERAIELYTRAIDLPGAPAELVAKALNNRGVVHGEQNRPQEAIADYTRAIDLPGAAAEQVAKALNNRGVVHGDQDH